MTERQIKAKETLNQFFPYLRRAIEKAKENGDVRFGILSYNPDNSGCVEYAEALIEAPPQTKEMDDNADAALFLMKHGLK
jgi:hypothetical protein